MASEFGFVFLILVLTASSLSFFEICIKSLGKDFVLFSQTKITNLIFTFTLLSFACLSYSFINSDFTLNVISKNSNSQLPLIYKFTGVWGNHEGSILLWLFVMTFFGFLFSKSSLASEDFKNDTLKIQNGLCFLITSFIVFTSNPFEKSFPPPAEILLKHLLYPCSPQAYMVSSGCQRPDGRKREKKTG